MKSAEPGDHGMDEMKHHLIVIKPLKIQSLRIGMYVEDHQSYTVQIIVSVRNRPRV